MTAPTQPVTIRLADFGGPVMEGITVTARLSDVDYTADGLFVSTVPVTGVTDANGEVVLDLFPNALVANGGLGTRGTTVRVTARMPGSKRLDVQAAIPNSPCELTDYLVSEEPQGLAGSQAAASDAQAARDLAKDWATKTDGEVVTGQGYGAKKYAQDAAANAQATAGDREQTGLDRVATGQDREQTGLDRAATSGDAAATAGDRSAVAADRTATELARDASFALGPKYADEPTGRAAVADGDAFLVQGAGNVAAYEYRRIDSTSSTLIALYPSADYVTSLRENIHGGGLALYTGAGPIYPIATDQDGNVVLGYDAANDQIVGNGLPSLTEALHRVKTDVLGAGGQADYTGSGPVYPLASDNEGKVVLGFDSASEKIVGPGILTNADVAAIVATASDPATLDDLAVKPVAKAINHLLFYGESTSVGTNGKPELSTRQPYSNVTFNGGPRAWDGTNWDFTGFKPLVEDSVSPAPDGGTNRGEVGVAGAANYAITLAVIENGISPADHVILGSTAGHGSYKISDLKKGTAWYSNLLSHVSNAKVLDPDYAVHALALILGINDAAANTPYATYRAAVEQFQADAEADIVGITGQATPVFLILNQISYGATTWPDQAKAQLDLAQKNAKVLLASPSYHFPYSGDAVHLTNVGYKWQGFYIGRVYKKLVIDGKKPKFLNPLSATIRGSEVRVRFDVPYPPMVLDTTTLASTTDYGFKVLDGATPAVISNVAVDGSDVVLTLSAAPAGAVTVRYGLDYLGTGLSITGGGSGNLRDSEPSAVAISGVDHALYNVCPHFELSAVALGE